MFPSDSVPNATAPSFAGSSIRRAIFGRNQRLPALLLMLLFAAAGCEQAVSGIADRQGAAPPLGQYSPVTAADIAGSRCTFRTGRRNQPDNFRWEFIQDEFRITGSNIPSELTELFDVHDNAECEITGSWKLQGKQIVMSDIHVDSTLQTDARVVVSVFKTAPTIVRIPIAGDQYVVSRIPNKRPGK